MKHGNGARDEKTVAEHLDRAWTLLEEGDPAGATAEADRALAVIPDHPDALTVRGAALAAGGDEDAALACFRRAMRVDPEYVTPILHAAELLVDPDRDPDEALRLTERALEVVEEEEDFVDAVLLKVQACLSLERDDEAREALAELPPVELPHLELQLRAAWAFLELEMLPEAKAHLASVLAKDADNADACHGLGLVAEAQDDFAARVAAWLRTRELDLTEPAPPWALSPEEFDAVAEEALAELPDKVQALLADVPILAEEAPSVEIVAEGYDPRLLGLFAGIPYPEKSNLMGAVPHLDAIHLYRRNIERVSRSREEIADEIRITVLHETGHFFGLSEEDLEQMGLG